MQGTAQQQYLKAMGVSSYVPRFRLPGALPSEQGVFPTAPLPAGDAAAADSAQNLGRHSVDSMLADSASGSGVTQPASGKLDKQASAAARAALDIDVGSAGPATRNSATKHSEPAAAPDDGAQSETPLQFAATLVDSATGLLFLAATSDADLSAVEKRLLANIAKAVCQQFTPDRSPAFQASSFNWPMLNAGPRLKGRMAQGKAQAKEAFTGFLLSHAERWQGTRLVVLGGVLEEYIAVEHLDSDGLKVISHVDVTTLMNSPQHKAQLWQKLCASFR